MGEYRLIRALKREPVDTTPVWLMRQAGRYLPEYRALRQKAGSFLALLKNPAWAATVTLQPLERFPLDAAILFADILTIPDAMGLGLSFVAGEGPRFAQPLRTRAAIEKLPRIDPLGELGYVLETVREARRRLEGRAPLIGFSGGPWTLGAYMIEGAGSRDFACARAFSWNQPRAVDLLMDKLIDAISDYLIGQAEAGAEALMIFESWAGLLAPDLFDRLLLDPLAAIVRQVKESPAAQGLPLIIFGRGAGMHLGELADLGCDALGLDWTADLTAARDQVGHKVALQGNLDPAILQTDESTVRRETSAMVAAWGTRPGYVFNLGHGISPDVSPDNVAALVETVHQSGKRGTPPE